MVYILCGIISNTKVFIIIILADLIIQSEQCARLGMEGRDRTVLHDQGKETLSIVHISMKKEADIG